jgi:uncharacterized protein with HEPN domain
MIRPDQVRLRHMVEAARDAVSFIEGKTRADLDSDRMRSLALVRCIEVIGEAASRLSPEFQQAHPEVPWPVIVATRNRLIHAYFDINLDIVWNTVVQDLPPLIETLEALIAAEPPYGDDL